MIAVAPGISAKRHTSEREWPSAINELRQHHRYTLNLLRSLGDVTQKFSHIPPQHADFVSDCFRYIGDFVDGHHHALEDLVLETLTVRNPEMRALAGTLGKAHARICRTGASILRRLEDTNADGLESELVRQIAEYTDQLSAHFEIEETELFPRAADILTSADWRKISEIVPVVHDPVFGRSIDERYAGLFDVYVKLVSEVGAPSSTPFPRVAATAIDYSGGLVDAARETFEVLQAGTERALRTNSVGMSRMLQAQSVSGLASGALRWIGESASVIFDTIRKATEVTVHANSGTFRPSGSALTSPAREFSRSFRVDDMPPSWQVQAINLAFRFTVKRMLSQGELSDLRKNMETVERFVPALPSDIVVHEITFGCARAEVFTVANMAPERTILHFPGGGFIFPATQVHRLMAARLARICAARVVMVHYRTAPEHPFPAGLDDCVAAYGHLLASGHDPHSITMCGDSAGGGMVLSALLRLRDEGLPMPGSAVLLSPLADLTYSSASRVDNRWNDPMLPLDRKNDLDSLYLAGASATSPLVSPVLADLHGFPPMLIQVGSTEILLDDALRIGARIRAHGGACDVEVWHEMPHVWFLIGILPEAVKAGRRIANFIAASGNRPGSG